MDADDRIARHVDVDVAGAMVNAPVRLARSFRWFGRVRCVDHAVDRMVGPCVADGGTRNRDGRAGCKQRVQRGLAQPVLLAHDAGGVLFLWWHGGHSNLVGRALDDPGGRMDIDRGCDRLVWHQPHHAVDVLDLGFDRPQAGSARHPSECVDHLGRAVELGGNEHLDHWSRPIG